MRTQTVAVVGLALLALAMLMALAGAAGWEMLVVLGLLALAASGVLLIVRAIRRT